MVTVDMYYIVENTRFDWCFMEPNEIKMKNGETLTVPPLISEESCNVFLEYATMQATAESGGFVYECCGVSPPSAERWKRRVADIFMEQIERYISRRF